MRDQITGKKRKIQKDYDNIYVIYFIYNICYIIIYKIYSLHNYLDVQTSLHNVIIRKH